MSEWHCLHLDDSLTAIIDEDRNRFLVRLREPEGQQRNPIEFTRWTLKDAMRAAERLVQAYYPHDCAAGHCGDWEKL